MAITLLRRESPGDAPGHPPPSRLRSLLIHVVHRLLGCIYPHQPHWPLSRIFHRNCDRWCVIVCMSIPNSSIGCSPQVTEEGSAWDHLTHCKRVLSWTHRMWNHGVRSSLRLQSLPTMIPLENVEVHQSEPWMAPEDLFIICRMNTDDVRRVSWILRNITDPEALADTIRWFYDGINVDPPPYDLIVATFKACFNPTRRVYPGSRDRAYYSGRAMM